VNAFGPVEDPCLLEDEILLMIEEFETVRLIDHQGLTQEECSQYMNIARTTVQQIYTDARQKIAAALVEGRSLRIGGGDYKICDGNGAGCGCGGCGRHGDGPKSPEKGEDTI